MTDASTTGAVERFDPYTDEGNREGYGEMEVQADGEWVRFTDYQAAIQRAEAAEERANRADAALRLLAREIVIAARRAAPTEGEAQSLDDTTRAVLDRAERIVAGQSQQEQRTAEIFLRPTEGEA